MTVATRLAIVEAAAAKLAATRGAKVSDILREGRARIIAGEPVPVQIHDVAVLEREAELPSIKGAMARGALRVLREVPPGALLPAAGVAKDGRGKVEGTGTPDSSPTRSTAPTPVVAGHSVSGGLVERIDQLLAAHARG